jgi:hypothetical protein
LTDPPWYQKVLSLFSAPKIHLADMGRARTFRAKAVTLGQLMAVVDRHNATSKCKGAVPPAGNATLYVDTLRLHQGLSPPIMQDRLRLASYCSFMGCISYL